MNPDYERYGHVPPHADARAIETAERLANAINAAGLPVKAGASHGFVTVTWDLPERPSWPWPRAFVARLGGRKGRR